MILEFKVVILLQIMLLSLALLTCILETEQNMTVLLQSGLFDLPSECDTNVYY